MRRDVLFVAEMIGAGERIVTLASGLDAAAVDGDPPQAHARRALRIAGFTVTEDPSGAVPAASAS